MINPRMGNHHRSVPQPGEFLCNALGKEGIRCASGRSERNGSLHRGELV